MSHNEDVAKIIRARLSKLPNVKVKKMFSGITFMVNDKMCISVGPNRIMCRIDPLTHDEMVSKPNVETVVMKGKSYRGFVYVNSKGIQTDAQINEWVDRCLEYNVHAKASAKKKKSVK